MELHDSTKNRDKFRRDIDMIKHRMTAAETDRETELAFGAKHSGTAHAFKRVRRDFLDLDIGDKKTIINDDTCARACKHKDVWLAAIKESEKYSDDEIAELRASRNSFGRKTYNSSLV